MNQQCRLCGEKKKLEVSHIIPKFVFRHQKNTSPTGFIRTTNNPNKATQDGIKLPFLCGDCEDIFSVWETIFANNIFYPYQKSEKQVFEYEEWLAKYLASVSFRVLVYVYEDCKLDYFSPEMLPYVDKAITNLKLYLLGQVEHPQDQRQLLLLLDTVDAESIKSYPDNFNLYLSRAIELDVITTDEESFIYIKYLRFLQLCPIKLVTNKGWRSARVNPKKGILRVQDHELPDYIGKKMIKSTSLLTSSKEDISEKQLDVIDTRVKNNLNKVIESEIGKATLAQIWAKIIR